MADWLNILFVSSLIGGRQSLKADHRWWLMMHSFFAMLLGAQVVVALVANRFFDDASFITICWRHCVAFGNVWRRVGERGKQNCLLSVKATTSCSNRKTRICPKQGGCFTTTSSLFFISSTSSSYFFCVYCCQLEEQPTLIITTLTHTHNTVCEGFCLMDCCLRFILQSSDPSSWFVNLHWRVSTLHQRIF